jgi:hypothetical protein
MGRGQNTRKNIHWRVEEWKRYIVVVWAVVTDITMKRTVMIFNSIFPQVNKRMNMYIPPNHLPSS